MMVFEQELHNVYDRRLRPRLLQSIMETYLPQDKNPAISPSQLSSAVSLIRRHRLLYEPHATKDKSAEGRKSIVDTWLDRVSVLLSSHVAENRWAGVSLIGVTSRECTLRRFVDSYGSWSQKLGTQLKSTEPAFVRAAVCASLTDIFTRIETLVEFPGVRRDAVMVAGKLVQPLLQILSDKDSSSFWGDAVDLLCAILKSFPMSLRQQYNVVEGWLAAQLMNAEGSAILLQKCALSLALLPRVHGEGSAWGSMICRALTAINTELDVAFAGMEDPKAPGVLLLGSQDPPWPSGGSALASTTSAQWTKRFWQQLVPRVSALVQCCRFLLVKPFPAPVHIPMTALLALVSRILRVDGSRVSTISPFGVSTAQQLALCCELPSLHGCAVDLLEATFCGARSEVLPHVTEIVGLLTDSFRQSGAFSAKLRIKLYGLVQQLLVGMGVGMAEALAPVVVENALSDLKVLNSAVAPFSSSGVHTSHPINASLGGTWGDLRHQRKRKEPDGLPVDQASVLHEENEVNEGFTSSPVQNAALKALEALLTAGGSLLPECVRMEVDSLLANLAVNISTRALCGSITNSVEKSLNSSSSSLHVAAYRALLASLLSPSSHRPPFLAQGLVLFQRGRKEVGTEIADVCAHAILALEPLIHPRCLPAADTSVACFSNLGMARTISAGMTANMQSSGRLGSGFAAVGAAPLVSTALNYGGPIVQTNKISQLTVDPWAEVDTWLGYGEDFSEDWREVFADDINDELMENTKVAERQLKGEHDIDTSLPVSTIDVATTGTDETMGMATDCQINLSVGTQHGITDGEPANPSKLFTSSQVATSEKTTKVGWHDVVDKPSNGVHLNRISKLSEEPSLQIRTENTDVDNLNSNGSAISSNFDLFQYSTAEAVNNKSEAAFGTEKLVGSASSKISSPLRTEADNSKENILTVPNSVAELRANQDADSDSDFIPEIVDDYPDTDYSQ